jgi:hypothetical protein
MPQVHNFAIRFEIERMWSPAMVLLALQFLHKSFHDIFVFLFAAVFEYFRNQSLELKLVLNSCRRDINVLGSRPSVF